MAASTAPTVMTLAALQLQRARQMAHTVGVEYQQPAHTFLAEKLPTKPELHRQVVLPGAKRAVTLDMLTDAQATGLGTDEIVARVNAGFDRVNAPRIAQFEGWRDGERVERLACARERETRRVSLQHKRDKEIEDQLDAELGTVD